MTRFARFLELSGMTTSISSVPAELPQQNLATTPRHTKPERWTRVVTPHTFASRFVFLILCSGIVLTTLAYGTVHSWSLAVFTLGAVALVGLWIADAWRLKSLRISRNLLQLPFIGAFALGVIQLLPFGGSNGAVNVALNPVRTLSADPYSTQFFLVQIAALLVYFGATLVFVDTPHRLKVLVRTITIFGFLLAMFGLTQALIGSPTKIYWVRELPQSTAFGPFINRHHFAGYMELAMAIPLGLLFSGVVEREKRLLYGFAVVLMGVALVMTNSRGGLISLLAEIGFLVIITTAGSKRLGNLDRNARALAALKRLGLATAILIVLVGGVVFLGGASVFTRFLGTVNADDPTTGRAHFWAVTTDIIKHHPIIGAGIGAYGVLYSQYDSRNGLYRLEQAHNDYLQVLADGGIIGAALGLFFLVVLFRVGFARRETHDAFRRGVSTGALAGCFAVLVHSFFDFTLHTTSNTLLFLVLAGLATMDSRVEREGSQRRRRRRTRSNHDLNPENGENALVV
jgi:O-antigen ligase